MARYDIRYIHKVKSDARDVVENVEISDSAFSDRKTLAACLRRKGLLLKGGSIYEMRIESDKVVAFPRLPGLSTYWHSIILTRRLDHDQG